MASFNSGTHIEAAIASVLASTLREIELIVIDDGSTDATIAKLALAGKADARLRWYQMPTNGGPAAARNQALLLATGKWFAVVDSDDLIAPNRFEILTALAEEQDADIIADNMVVFADDAAESAHRFFGKTIPPHGIDLSTYLDSISVFGATLDYGYLKPLFRLSRLRDAALAYDVSLRIAEDDDLIVRALLTGLRYRWEPVLTYGYRKHSASISYRLSTTRAEAIVAASAPLISRKTDDQTHKLLIKRHGRFETVMNFSRLVDAIKAKDVARSFRIAAHDPRALAMLQLPIAAAMRRILRLDPPMPPGEVDAATAFASMVPSGR